jgi:hypothetical protein
MVRLRSWKAREAEPSSIYEHLLRLISEDCAELDDQPLPDDALAFGDGDLKWAAGALDRASWRHFARDDSATGDVKATHVALAALSARPGMKTRAAVRRRFREGIDREVVDRLLERFWSHPPADLDSLYSELRSLLLESGRRDEVKWAIALLGTFGRAEDADLFRVFGRHSEFALYAAVALSHVVDDPVPEWRELLRHSDGWGKVELVELLLRDPSPETCGLLLREGVSYENALALATGCRLDTALARDEVDDDLLAGARSIIDSLTGVFPNPDELTDWQEAGAAVERFLYHFEPRARTLDDFLTAQGLVAYLEPQPEDSSWYEERGEDPPQPLDLDEHRERLAAVGLGADRAATVVRRCRGILQRPEWPARAMAALTAADDTTRTNGIQVATRLGLSIRPYLFEEIEKSPNDYGLWFELVYKAPQEEFVSALELAERILDLNGLAAGAALDLFGPPGAEGPHNAVMFILQELPRFPGAGRRLLEASLRSPVIGHRFSALRALARWPRPLPESVRAILLETLKDPDEEVRSDARAVLEGRPLARD